MRRPGRATPGSLPPVTRHIVACGGGGWAAGGRGGPLEDYILGLAARDRPRVCLLPTASGDADAVIARFYESFSGAVCEPSHLALFRPHPEPARPLLARADVVYVPGGSRPTSRRCGTSTASGRSCARRGSGAS